MAGKKPVLPRPAPRIEHQSMPSRKVMLWVIGGLLAVLLACVGGVFLMLQRLEVRNANFQPPMTARERERLLPPEPTLSASPVIEGLHYGSLPQGEIKTDPSLGAMSSESDVVSTHAALGSAGLRSAQP